MVKPPTPIDHPTQGEDWRSRMTRENLVRDVQERLRLMISMTEGHSGDICMCNTCCDLRDFARGLPGR